VGVAGGGWGYLVARITVDFFRCQRRRLACVPASCLQLHAVFVAAAAIVE